MPSGSKKRKAAKKKKESHSNDNPTPSSASTQSHGGDDVEHQDDKERDVGEVSSLGSQDDHSHQNLKVKGEKEEIDKGENISNLPYVEGVKTETVDETNITMEAANVVPVEKGFKIKDESSEKDGKIEHQATSSKSYDGRSSSSSSSRSDDESSDIKSSQSVKDGVPIVDSVKTTDALCEGKADAIANATIEETIDSVSENITAIVSERISLSCEKSEENLSSSAHNYLAPSLGEAVFKENGEKKLSSIERKVGISTSSKDDASKRKEEASIPSVEKIATISDLKEGATQATDDRLTPSYDAPLATAENGAAGHEEDSVVAEPVLAPAPPAVPTTSWKSCCGLFEVFTGSGR